MNMDFERKLAIPMEVKEMYPLTQALSLVIEKRIIETKKIFSGEDKRLILIIGPCSADNEDSVLEYSLKLRDLYEEVKEKIFIIPRVFTNKPRTTGEGYKGLLHQPDPKEKPDLFKGIIATRELHMKVVKESGLTSADEMLYPENYKYIDDILGYVTVGARSVEDQQHRLTASGIEIPCGMKNPTGGDFKVMLNAISAAQHAHSFIYRGWAAHSHGNEYAHAVLRGYTNMAGDNIPNYGYENLVKLCDFYEEYELKHPALIVDTNHANSGKDPLKQPEIAERVLESAKRDSRIKKLLKGFMVESYLEDGAQSVDGGVYGKSITDPCLGFEKTRKFVLELAEKLDI